VRKITIQLTNEEQAVFEYRLFEYQGLQINFDQVLNSGFKFDEHHYDRVILSLTEKYAAFQKCLMSVLTSHGYADICVKAYDFFLDNGELIIEIG